MIVRKGKDDSIQAETPGAIHEGGELGYCLAVAYGSVMDKPDHITVAVIGDGESETGPTAAAWHAHKVCISHKSTSLLTTVKYLDPAESGAVLPILHVNGFKVCDLYERLLTVTRLVREPFRELWTTLR